jgi:hypothetical protein
MAAGRVRDLFSARGIADIGQAGTDQISIMVRAPDYPLLRKPAEIPLMVI